MTNISTFRKTAMRISIVCFLLSSIMAIGQVRFPKDFIRTKPPKVGSSFWHSLNDSDEFYVSLKNGKLKVEELEDEIDTCSFRVKNGMLKGKDYGEFGGSLTFVPDDTTQKVRLVRKGNINSIFSYKGKIYGLEGLAHLSTSRGSLFEILEADSGFTCREVLRLPDAPTVMTFFQDAILIVAFESLLLVKDFKTNVLIQKAFWNGLYPNSVVVHNEKAYLGMRGGIVCVNLKNQKLRFFRHIDVELDEDDDD